MPALRSCHLDAGHRLVGTQAPSRLRPGGICDPGFDGIVHDCNASSVVHGRSSPQPSPHAVSLRLSVSLTPMALDHSRLRRFAAPTCLAASEGLPPSRVQRARRTRPGRARCTHTVPQAEPLLPLVPSRGGLVTRLVRAVSLSCLFPRGHAARRRLPSRGSRGPWFPTCTGTLRRDDCHPAPLRVLCVSRVP